MNEHRLTDANVARTLWKALVIHDSETGESYLSGSDWKKVSLPHFSSNVEDAHQVVAYMQSIGWTLSVKQDIDHGESSYLAVFVKNDNRVYTNCRAKTLPMAICLAALSTYVNLSLKKVNL